MEEERIREIRKGMASGEIGGFFIYDEGGREIDFMEKNRPKKSIKRKFWQLWKP